MESQLAEEYEEDRFENAYIYEPIGSDKDRQFSLLLKFSIINLVLVILPLILLFLVYAEIA